MRGGNTYPMRPFSAERREVVPPFAFRKIKSGSPNETGTINAYVSSGILESRDQQDLADFSCACELTADRINPSLDEGGKKNRSRDCLKKKEVLLGRTLRVMFPLPVRQETELATIALGYSN